MLNGLMIRVTLLFDGPLCSLTSPTCRERRAHHAPGTALHRRSRRDCDKMLEMMRRIKEDLQRTKSVFNNAEAGIRAQLDGPAAGKNTGRLSGLFGRGAASGEQFVAAKLADPADVS